ncbi:KilA-N domain-containing protein [Nostocaceae cyanobacterium CENA369]|uniref:KilA-N domain-containing protein n=1 Tax=Dendronalium phyllosphericum CENA369 TaxID=1725256 RepID=A0A8J7ID08_9NOST|nr:KilA-N domain-containing protein [Dendronalium phyllosphericum]MBH8577960.1 KilA-N domain-containing protein [Dendronalium phyllosphericum CENA369]
MSEIEQFSTLIQATQREDGYVNATKWCKHFGYRIDNWKKLPETKARLNELTESLKIREFNYTNSTYCIKTTELIYSTGRGYGAITWVHPVIAVHLASYLDPAFANYVAQIFVRYVTADPSLAADIALRQNSLEGLKVINEAVQKRYSFLYGRDWFCLLPEHKPSKRLSEFVSKYPESKLMRLLNEKFGLPYKRFVVIFPCGESLYSDLIPYDDFFKEKYSDIHSRLYKYVELNGRSIPILEVETEVALVSYFALEIDAWVKEKNRS